MIQRDAVVSYLDSLFQVHSVSEISWNGLQFEGSDAVRTIAFAVDSGIATFAKAAEANADMLIVHHGLFWGKANPVITGVHRKRIGILFENNLSLYAMHLPLDAHGELGNNSGLLKLIGAEPSGRFCDCHPLKLGALGSFSSPQNIDSLAEKLGSTLNCIPKLLRVSDEPITNVAAMSGACGRDDLIEAAQLGVQLLITGEQSEFYHDAHDYGISVLFLGHHASETVGISLLQDHMQKQFPNIEMVWVACPTLL